MKKSKPSQLNRITSIEDAEQFDIENDERYERIQSKKDKHIDIADDIDPKRVKNLKQSKIDQMLKDFDDVRRSLRSEKYYD